MEAPRKTFKESLKDYTVCNGVEFLARALEWAMHEILRGKVNLQWRPQDVLEANNVKCPLRRISGTEGSKPKRQTHICYRK